MKKNLLRMAAAALMFCCAANVLAAGDEKNGHAYFTKAELPNMSNILPAPPAFESARFVADQSQHLWGKLMRLDEARSAQAQRDAVYSMLGQLAKARAEFAEKTAGSTTRVVGATRSRQQNASAPVYRLDGTPANDASQGILVQDNQKFVRK